MNSVTKKFISRSAFTFKENIKKFQEEAKKYEQSETLSTRVKFVNKIKVSFENYLVLFDCIGDLTNSSLAV